MRVRVRIGCRRSSYGSAKRPSPLRLTPGTATLQSAWGDSVEVGQRRALAVEWATLAEYYRSPLSDVVVSLYVSDLSDLPLGAVLDAMRGMRRDAKRRHLPLPADVRERAAGTGRCDAGEIAAKLCASIAKFGYTSPDRARAYMGEVGWAIVGRFGGWAQLCNTLTTAEMNTFRAQVREVCRVEIDRQEQTKKSDTPALLGFANAELPG